MASTYSISDLAKEFDLTTRAMRFYEDLGLLQPTRTGPGGRNRTYSNRDRTRLRLTLGDKTKVDEAQLKALGAKAVVHVGEKNLQVILGPMAEIIAGEMNAINN